MTDLAQQCEEIRQSDNRRLLADLRQRLPQLDDEYFPLLGNVTQVSEQIDTLLAYISELKLQLSTATEQLDQWHELDEANKATIAQLQSELAALRRPVVQNEWIEAEREYCRETELMEAAGYPIGVLRSTHASTANRLLSHLDHSEREKALVGEALGWVLENGIMKATFTDDCEAKVIFVSNGDYEDAEPPAHLLPILLRHAGSKQA